MQQLLPFLRVQDGELRWVVTDQDGHALAVYTSEGDELQFDLGGVYGERLDSPTWDWFRTDANLLAEPWELDALHGSEPDRKMGLVHHGARHVLLDDGRWLQPEPLLKAGFAKPTPRLVAATHAAGDPLNLSDQDGYWPTLAESFQSTMSGMGSGLISPLTGPLRPVVLRSWPRPTSTRSGNTRPHLRESLTPPVPAPWSSGPPSTGSRASTPG